jgi:predicted nucleic acid-binding protein
MKTQFAKARTAGEKQQIVNNFVEELRLANLSNDEIVKIGNIERLLESQGNRIMISNTQE